MITLSGDYENRVTWYIYVLIDPRNGDEFYIGRTADPRIRLRAHINLSQNMSAKQYASSLHVREIIASGLEPIMRIIDSVVTSNLLMNWGDASQLEKRWIKEYKLRGKAWCNDKPAIVNIP